MYNWYQMDFLFMFRKQSLSIRKSGIETCVGLKEAPKSLLRCMIAIKWVVCLRSIKRLCPLVNEVIELHVSKVGSLKLVHWYNWYQMDCSFTIHNQSLSICKSGNSTTCVQNRPLKRMWFCTTGIEWTVPLQFAKRLCLFVNEVIGLPVSKVGS